ncbi:MAG: class IV adenylate cyclase [Microgenomates group bacterium]
MQIEYEAKFLNIKRFAIRKALKAIGAKLVRSEFVQKRIAFKIPGIKANNLYLRVRDEGDKITVSLKSANEGKIKGQKEIQITVNDFLMAVQLLKSLGCKEKAYQETKRELWKIDSVEVTIDEWPYLEPFTEIEGKNELSVKQIAQKLGFNYKDAIFGAVDTLYNKKYGVSKDIINNHTPRITFDSPNPFLKKA